MKNEKIGFFVRNFAGGGAELVTISLANKFAEWGLDVTCFVISNSGDHKQKVDGRVRVVVLGSKRLMLSFLKLRNELILNKIEVVYSNMTHENLVAICASRNLKLKLIGVEHNNLDEEISRRGRITYLSTIVLVRILYRYLDHLVCVSEGVKELFTNRYGLNNVTRIYNPIAAPNNRKEHLNPRSGYILGVGRLTKQKNFELLIRTYAILKKNGYKGRLVILGEGEEDQKLKEIAKNLNIDKEIDFLGFIQNAYPFFINAECLVLSSLWEGFGNVIVEALLCGTKVVAVDCKFGPSEILENGKYGTLVSSHDPETLAKAVEKELRITRSRESLIKRGSDFSVEKIAKQYLGLVK